MKVKIEPDMEQQTGSKLGKEYVKAVYCHPAYLTSMPDWMKHKLKSRLQGKISISSDTQMCWGPAPVDPGNSKGGRRWRGKTCLLIDIRLD